MIITKWAPYHGYRCSNREIMSFPRVDPWSEFYRRAMWKVPIYPRDFGRLTNPYPRWIKQGTSGGPGTYEGGNYPAWNYQPLTRRGARPRTRPNHRRARVTASVRALDYHGTRAAESGEKPVLLFRGFAEILRIFRRVRSEFFHHPRRRFEDRRG